MSKIMMVVAVLALNGCVHPAYQVGIMARSVEAGDCSETLNRARIIHGDVPGFSVVKQVHYNLYLALAYMCLGEEDLARFYLARTEVLVRRHPMSLLGSHRTNYEMISSRLAVNYDADLCPRTAPTCATQTVLIIRAAEQGLEQDCLVYQRRLRYEAAERYNRQDQDIPVEYQNPLCIN